MKAAIFWVVVALAGALIVGLLLAGYLDSTVGNYNPAP